MQRRTLTIAVLTYRRPETLRMSLPSILQQVRDINADTTARITARLLVIDNDPAQSARGVVEEVVAGGGHYVLEPEPGISAGRNRALDWAGDDDLLIFIDDDEEPQPGWLRALVDTWRDTQAAAVMGRVVSVFHSTVDPWVAAGDFFRRPRMPTGTQINVAAAGNLLLDLGQVRQSGARFDSRLGLSGGEDNLFSRQLVQHGGRMVWCDESVAHDIVPPDRVTRDWLLKRAWSHGNTASVIELYLAHGPTARLTVKIRAVSSGMVRVAGGYGRYALGRVIGSARHEARGLRTARRGAGMIAASAGRVYEEYSRGEPRR